MGEPDFDTPAVVVDAAVDALRTGHTHYVDMTGDPQLRALIASTASVVACAGDRARIGVGRHGGAAAITASVLALVDPATG